MNEGCWSVLRHQLPTSNAGRPNAASSFDAFLAEDALFEIGKPTLDTMEAFANKSGAGIFSILEETDIEGAERLFDHQTATLWRRVLRAAKATTNLRPLQASVEVDEHGETKLSVTKLRLEFKKGIHRIRPTIQMVDEFGQRLKMMANEPA